MSRTATTRRETAEEVDAELRAWEGQFAVERLPAGTPGDARRLTTRRGPPAWPTRREP